MVTRTLAHKTGSRIHASTDISSPVNRETHLAFPGNAVSEERVNDPFYASTNIALGHDQSTNIMCVSHQAIEYGSRVVKEFTLLPGVMTRNFDIASAIIPLKLEQSIRNGIPSNNIISELESFEKFLITLSTSERIVTSYTVQNETYYQNANKASTLPSSRFNPIIPSLPQKTISFESYQSVNVLSTSLPAVSTYAEATNLAARYRERASEILSQPLCGASLCANEILGPQRGKRSRSVTDPSENLHSGHGGNAGHTADRPNWALAPDDPQPRRKRRRGAKKSKSEGRNDEGQARDRNERRKGSKGGGRGGRVCGGSCREGSRSTLYDMERVTDGLSRLGIGRK